MRHLGSIVLSLFLTALVYVLTGVGLANWALALSSSGTSEDYVKLGMALAALGVAGVLYGVLTLTRLSPLGPALSGLTLFGLAMWAALAFSSYTDTMPSRILGVDGTDFAAAGSGAAALLAVPLIATVLSPRRWRRWANPPAAVPAPGYAPPGYGAPAAPAAPYPGQPAAPAAQYPSQPAAPAYGAPYPTSPAGPSAPQSPSPAYAAPGYAAPPDKTSVMTAPASPAAGYPPPGPAAPYGQGAPYGQPAQAYPAGPAYPPPAAPSSAPPAPSAPPPSSGPPAYATPTSAPPTSAPPAYGPQQPGAAPSSGAPSSGAPSSAAPSSGPPVWPSAPPAQQPGDQVDPDATRKL